MLSRCDARSNRRVGDRSQRSRWHKISRGQSLVEFALISPLALAVMLIGVQFAIIGQAALEVGQGASALARYAAANPGTMGPNGSVTGGSLPSAAQNMLSPSILTHSGADLSVTMASYSGSTTTTTGSPAYNDRAVVSLSYDVTSKIFLPKNTLLGISFPTKVSASDSQLYE